MHILAPFEGGGQRQGVDLRRAVHSTSSRAMAPVCLVEQCELCKRDEEPATSVENNYLLDEMDEYDKLNKWMVAR
eukprot:11570999-Heterocapsa_arctica.AAC.1